MRKKKILHVTEASFLKTGYANYSYEVLKRLYATGKYEIAELGCFAERNDPQQKRLPWKFYGNLPDPRNQEEVNFYESNKNEHAFGSWKFEEILLDFQPDIVWDVRDWWMHEFEERSPFRPYYHWCIMPTVDAIPQHPQWLSTFMNADSVFSYSDWGVEQLKQSCHGLIKTVGSAPPGADIQNFAPVKDKKQHKLRWGLAGDSIIVGTVMRNQKRKLYPDLIASFAQFLKEAPQHIAERSFLYMHTSFPDWWDLPALIAEHGVSHKCIFTYKCKACGHVFISLFRDARAVCTNCYNTEAFLPQTHFGATREELVNILNLFDVYVQYSNSEGFGLPQVEAASCGVPVMSIDYSAMSDVVRKLRGYPLKYLKLQREAETGCDRAIPDNQFFVDTLLKYVQLPETWQNKKKFEARSGVEKHYTWDKTAKIWENHFDSIPLRDRSETWESPKKIHQPVLQFPANMPSAQFIDWAFTHVAGRPELSNHYMAIRLLRDIQWGSTTDSTGGFYYNELSAIGARPNRREFNRDDAVKELVKLCEYKNFWEERRWETISKGF